MSVEVNKKVVILGKNYSTTLGVIRALGEYGYDIDCFFIPSISKIAHISDNDIVKSSSYLTRYFKTTRENIINDILKQYSKSTEKILLISSDDLTLSYIDNKRKELSRFFIMPSLKKEAGSITKLLDKSVQKKMAESFGLSCAKSWIISSKDGIYRIPKDINYPCFFKPLQSISGGKSGMKKCNSASELESELTAIPTEKQYTVLVQEYLDIEEEFSISGICFGNKVYLPALLKKSRVSQSHKGTTVYGIVEDISKIGNVYYQLIKMLSNMSLYSIIDVEIFKCKDKIYFNEINFRSSAVCYGAVGAGANIPGLYADAMFSGTFEIPKNKISYGNKFICEKAAWDDYMAGFISKQELQKMYNEADTFIIRNEKDLLPENYFRKYLIWKKIRIAVKKLLPIK